MWRYVAGGVAALLMAAAGWLIFSGQAKPDRPLVAEAPASDDDSAAGEATVAGGVALPTADRSREQKRFDRYDKDRDARITRAEYLAPRQKAFAKLDTNGDGRLTFDEWAAKTTQRFATADRDRSGALTAAEFATTRPKRSTAAKPRCVCPQPAETSED